MESSLQSSKLSMVMPLIKLKLSQESSKLHRLGMKGGSAFGSTVASPGFLCGTLGGKADRSSSAWHDVRLGSRGGKEQQRERSGIVGALEYFLRSLKLPSFSSCDGTLDQRQRAGGGGGGGTEASGMADDDLWSFFCADLQGSAGIDRLRSGFCILTTNRGASPVVDLERLGKKLLLFTRATPPQVVPVQMLGVSQVIIGSILGAMF